MRFFSLGTLKSLFVPGGLLLGIVVALTYSGWMTLAPPTLTFLYYSTLAGGLLLAWRFHSSRIFLSLLVLLLAQQAEVLSVAQPPFIPSTLHALAMLLPMNFIFIALIHERGFTTESLAPPVLLLFIQALTLTVFCGAAYRAGSLPNPVLLPRVATIVLVATAIFLCVRFFVKRKPVESALLWSLGAFFFALRYAADSRISTAYWTTASCLLATAVIENSYLLAYHDELTTLPSRRAFNQALLRLKSPYSIAVVDIDHFKRFNDTYGHDTGDQVLRLVAANLARVSGGGQAYRCGGEEFNILFPGKTCAEVVSHLQELRETIRNSQFRMRGQDRRQAARGPDRRNQRKRARKRPGPRQASEQSSTFMLSVTVSIGVATSTAENSAPETVLESADKALYRAKANGRNRVESSVSARPLRSQAARMA